MLESKWVGRKRLPTRVLATALSRSGSLPLEISASRSLFGTKLTNALPATPRGVAITGGGSNSNQSSAACDFTETDAPQAVPAISAWKRRAGDGGHSLALRWSRP